jgi:hypothetical protein
MLFDMKKAKLLGFSLLIFAVLLAILFGCMEFAFRYLDLKDSKELPYHGETGKYVPHGRRSTDCDELLRAS